MLNSDIDGSSRRFPVTVLTGFLGSGKTTVLNHLIGQEGLKRTLVLINEFGEIGIDHDLVTQSNEELVIEMAAGCLCCTIRGDLTDTLRNAPHRFARQGKAWFDRVVIETTGLADPAPILQTVMADPTVARKYRLDGVITTVDAVNGDDTLDRQIESVKQAAVADRLLITKSDLVETEKRERLQNRLRDLNPSATQIITNNGVVSPDKLFDVGLYDPKTKTVDVRRWLQAESIAEHQHHAHDHDHNDVNRHDEHIKAVCLTFDEPIRGEALDRWLDDQLLPRGPDFLRTKGIINIDGLDKPLVIHGVQEIFHPPLLLPEWPSDDHRTRIVFITRDIDVAPLRDRLLQINEEELLKPNPLFQSD